MDDRGENVGDGVEVADGFINERAATEVVTTTPDETCWVISASVFTSPSRLI